jgi:hypothetical protein
MSETVRRLTNDVQDKEAALAVILRDSLEACDPDALVGATAEPGYRSTVDGRFDLFQVASRLIARAKSEGLV